MVHDGISWPSQRYASNCSRTLALGTKQCLVIFGQPLKEYPYPHTEIPTLPSAGSNSSSDFPHPGIKIRSTAESDSSRTNSRDLTCGSRWGQVWTIQGCSQEITTCERQKFCIWLKMRQQRADKIFIFASATNSLKTRIFWPRIWSHTHFLFVSRSMLEKIREFATISTKSTRFPRDTK